MKNYFISIKIPRELGKIIFEKIKEKDLLKFIKGKYISFEDYHFTLRFFGEIKDKQIEEIKEKLKKVDFESFDCELNKLGIFENKFNGVLWVGSDSEKVEKLVEKIWNNVGGEKRKFHVHSTIIRFKNILDKVKLLEEIGEINLEDLHFKIDKFYLMKSELLPEGAKYQTIEKYSLS